MYSDCVCLVIFNGRLYFRCFLEKSFIFHLYSSTVFFGRDFFCSTFLVSRMICPTLVSYDLLFLCQPFTAWQTSELNSYYIMKHYITLYSMYTAVEKTKLPDVKIWGILWVRLCDTVKWKNYYSCMNSQLEDSCRLDCAVLQLKERLTVLEILQFMPSLKIRKGFLVKSCWSSHGKISSLFITKYQK